MTALVELLDWSLLPEETKPIAALLVDGLTQAEIAAQLEATEAWVAARVAELRAAMLEQVKGHVSEEAKLVLGRVEELRSSTARVAGGGRSGSARRSAG